MIRGFATSDGTTRFAARGIAANGHFRDFRELRLSSVGMGTYLGDVDSETDNLVERAVIASVSSGAINVIDTAINYRHQRAERAVGRALANGKIRRDEVFISTKNGYLTGDGELNEDPESYIMRELVGKGVIKEDDISTGYHCMTLPYLEDQLERSRKNIGLETIDLLYLHNSAEGQLRDIGMDEYLRRLLETFRFYEKKKEEGKIRFYGMATWSCFRSQRGSFDYLNLEEIIELAKKAGGKSNGFAAVQLPFNFMMKEALESRNQTFHGKEMSFLEAAKLMGIGVFASVPLMQGRLVTARLPEMKGINSQSLKCIQFARMHTTPLVGQKEPSHVKENIEIAKIAL